MIKILKNNIYAVRKEDIYNYYIVLTNQILFGGNLAIKLDIISDNIISSETILSSDFKKEDMKIYDFYRVNKDGKVIKINSVNNDFTSFKYLVYHNTKIYGLLTADGQEAEPSDHIFQKENFYYVFSIDDLSKELFIFESRKDFLFYQNEYVDIDFTTLVL